MDRLPAYILEELNKCIVEQRVLHDLQTQDIHAGENVPEEVQGVHLRNIKHIEEFINENGGQF